MELTTEEKTFLLQLLAQLTIKPSAGDSANVVKIVQELIVKLS